MANKFEQLEQKLNDLEELLRSKRWSRKATHEWLDMIDAVKAQIKELENE